MGVRLAVHGGSWCAEPVALEDVPTGRTEDGLDERSGPIGIGAGLGDDGRSAERTGAGMGLVVGLIFVFLTPLLI